MIKVLGKIFFYGITFLLVFAVLCQVGLLPFRLVYFLSGSMQPTYQPGDLAFVYVGKNIQVNNGDVILFLFEGAPTMHRAISIEEIGITTQGDANSNPDNEKVTHVEGKLLFAIPKIGYVLDGIQIAIQNLTFWVKGII